MCVVLDLCKTTSIYQTVKQCIYIRLIIQIRPIILKCVPVIGWQVNLKTHIMASFCSSVYPLKPRPCEAYCFSVVFHVVMHSLSMRYKVCGTAFTMESTWVSVTLSDWWLVLVGVTGCLLVWKAQSLLGFYSQKNLGLMNNSDLSAALLLQWLVFLFNLSHHSVLWPSLSLPVSLALPVTHALIVAVSLHSRYWGNRWVAASDVGNRGNCSFTCFGINTLLVLPFKKQKPPDSLHSWRRQN